MKERRNPPDGTLENYELCGPASNTLYKKQAQHDIYCGKQREGAQRSAADPYAFAAVSGPAL
jgi:hypothetical protein